MKNPDYNQYTKNNFLLYLILLVSFFILLFFTKNFYSDLQVKLDTQSLKEQQLQKKESTLTSLNELQAKLKDPKSEAVEEIKWFTGVYSDENILEYIYMYAQKVNLTDERLVVRDMVIENEGTSDIWFEKATVTVSAVFSAESTMLDFITYLTDVGGNYKFYIDTFEYEMNASTGNIQATIPLILYYNK